MGVKGEAEYEQEGHNIPLGGALEIGVKPQSSQLSDDDGRPRRTGTMWTASAHIITAVVGSGVLSLAWAIAQLGWVAGPAAMLLFAFVIYYTSGLLSDCYRSGDPDTGKRNYTYMEVVQANLGGVKVKLCGYLQYISLFGTAIGYTIAASISMAAIEKANCFHENGDDYPCRGSSTGYMITFGVTQVLFSQIPNFGEIWWLSIVAAVMSFTYSIIGLGLGVAEVVKHGHFRGSASGVPVGAGVSPASKAWHSLQALGDIAFAYAYSIILIEIQDTIKSPPPSEAKVMKRATLVSVLVTTVFYLLCGCMGYAAFGNAAPDNLLTGFGFYNPYWLLDIANVAIVVHLVGAYQVYCQPLFAFVERAARELWPESGFVHRDFFVAGCRLNGFRMAWRSSFVILTTLLAMMLPFFSDIVGLMGALGFWPLTVYFPVEMYIAQKKVERWSKKWVCLQLLSLGCLIVSGAAVIGSLASIVLHVKAFRPFKSAY